MYVQVFTNKLSVLLCSVFFCSMFKRNDVERVGRNVIVTRLFFNFYIGQLIMCF